MTTFFVVVISMGIFIGGLSNPISFSSQFNIFVKGVNKTKSLGFMHLHLISNEDSDRPRPQVRVLML